MSIRAFGLLLLFFLCPVKQWAVTPADSLYKIINSNQSDSLKIEARLSLTRMLKTTDQAAAYTHAQEALDLSRRMKNPYFLGSSFKALGTYYFAQNNYRLSVENLLLAERYFEKAQMERERASVLNWIGMVYLEAGNQFDALTKFTEAEKILAPFSDPYATSIVYNNMGAAYFQLEYYDLAERYYKKIFDLPVLDDNPVSKSFLLNNLGEVALVKKDFIQAKQLFISAINIQLNAGNRDALSLDFLNLAKTYTFLGDYDSARVCFDEASIIARENDDQYGLINANGEVSVLYNRQGEYAEAVRVAEQWLQGAQSLGVLIPQRESHYNLYLAYQGLGDYKNALNHLSAYNSIRDSIQQGGDKFGLLQIESDFDTVSSIPDYDLEQLGLSEKSFYEQEWFVLLMFFVLVGILVFVLEARRRVAPLPNSKTNLAIDYLHSDRILFVLGATLYSTLPFVVPKINPVADDWFGARLIISGVILGTYFCTFLFVWFRKNVDRLTVFCYMLLLGHNFYLIYINKISIDYVFYLMVILSGAIAVFKKTKSLVFFTLFVIAVSLLIGLSVSDPQLNIITYFGFVVAALAVSIVIAFSREDVDKYLEFSNEAVNQSDAIVFIVNRKGENIYTSQSIKNILGHDPQVFTGHDWIEKLGVEQSEANRIKHNLILIAIGAIEPKFNPYQMLRNKEGEIKWFSIKEKRLARDRVLVIGLDVTENKKIQDELATSESNFRQINETLTDVFYLYNLGEQKCEYISPNSEQIMGAPPDFFYRNESHTEHFVCEQDEAMVREAAEMVSNGIPFDIEYRVVIKDEIRWVREKSYPIRNEEGIVVKHSGLCQDITDRKRAEEEIQKLSLIASNTDNFILMVNKENRVEWANQSFFNLTGYSEAETVGELPLALISGRLTNETLIDEIGHAVFTDKRQMRCEMINYKKDESIFYSSLEITPLLDADGNLEKYFVIGSDISQRVADQEQIEKLSLVASNTSNYIIIANNDTGIEWVNEAFTEKFGYTLEEAQGHFPSALLHAKNTGLEQMQEINRVVFDQQQRYTGEIIHLTKSGNQIYSNVNITPLMSSENEVEKYFVLGVDISDRIRNEEAIQKANLELSIKERALNESEQNFRQLIKSIKEVFWLADFETDQMIFVSDSYEEVFGRKAVTLMEDDQSWRNLIHPADRDFVIKSLEKNGKIGRFNEDFRIVLDSGQEKWVNSRVFTIRSNEGLPTKLSGFVEDITDKKVNELRVKKIADQLDIIHSIEKTILRSESTTEIIYNTLDKTLDKLPVLSASLALFDKENNCFYAYDRMKNGDTTPADGKEFELDDFELYEELNLKRDNLIEDLTLKENKSVMDKMLTSQGVKIALLSPLIHGDHLIGSLKVCFTELYEQNADHYLEITNEVANGLAIAIYQSQLKDKLHTSNSAITSSIDYAKMIQQSYIPAPFQVAEYFEESFIINRPKDIVSGDFYWVGVHDHIRVLAVGDCTGHGVPGAFMTIIGISELTNIVSFQGIVDPAEILTELDLRIKEALSSKSSVQLKDGMDLGIFCYNTITGEASYAGARRPLYQMTANGLSITNGARLSIGDTGDDFGIRFTSLPVTISSGDIFYIFSDGCSDQFGGEQIRKFSRKRLEIAIEDNSNLPMEEQKHNIEKAITDWQGNYFQTDDILFVGFKVK